MAWRKRRRYRLANIVSYFCAFFGVVFIVGNVIMLREGFVQLYSTTFGERTSFSQHAHRADDRDKWRENGNFPALQIPPLELPTSALKAELRLRKLMENENIIGYNSKYLSDKHLSEELKYLQRVELSTSGKVPRDLSVIRMTSSDLRRSLHLTSDCPGLTNKTHMPIIGSGWTKIVYQTKYKQENVALKMVDPSGHDLSTCMEEHRHWGRYQCYEHSAQKILKEIVLLRGLQHPHIIQVLGHCVPETPYIGNHDNMVSMATELGESVDIISLLHMSWEDRLRISYGLTKLLFYLAHSPYGSVVLNDFRRQQFVLVSGNLKLTDLDDMGFLESPCMLDIDCQQYYSSANITLTAKCINSQCMGLNEKKNIFNAARHFTTFLLPHGAPKALRPMVDSLVGHFSNAAKDTGGLLKDMTVIVDAFSSGSYLDQKKRDHTTYKKVPSSDLPGTYDYRCRYTMGSSGCTVSVYDQREAEQLCDRDEQCQGFVLTERRTWTGRIVAHFKNGIGPVTANLQANVFIKPN